MSLPLDDKNDYRFSLKQEISNVFKDALRRYVPDLPDEEPEILDCKKKEFGDYYCYNHITIWEQKRDDHEGFEKINLISKGIKDNISKSVMSEMMEFCEVFGIGYLCFKLSKKWIAKNIQKMLTHSIDTWAPKLSMKKVVVDFSSRNITEEMGVGHLRSTIIGDACARMLEFSKVDVVRRNRLGDRGTQVGMLIEFLFEWFPIGEANYLTIEELEVIYKETKKMYDEDAGFRKRVQQAVVSLQGGDERFQNVYAQICEINRKGYEKVYKHLRVPIEEKSKSIYDPNILRILDILREVDGLIENREGDEVIFVKEKETMHHVSIERKTIPLTVVKKDGSCDIALTDLADLWYEVYEEKADRIVYVSDVRKEEYVELCFAAARRAGWLPADEKEYPSTMFVGYGHVEGDDLNSFQVIDLLDKAKSHCKAALVEQGKAKEWTAEELDHAAEALGYGALKYAELKKPRYLKLTVNFDEMLNDKGNTGVYLLYTHAQICSIIRKSVKDIQKLKKGGVLKLIKDVERELGLHLLQFTEAVENSCTYVMPYVLCDYLYKLCEKWTSFYSKCQIDGCREQTSRLLLCEATRVVMAKCFHLLGITPIRKIYDH